MTRPMTQRIASLIEKGVSNKAIVAKLKCKPQQVYNTRHYMKKQAEVARMIGRKKIRIVKLASGNNPKPATKLLPAEIIESPEMRAPLITYYEEPSLWARIKSWFA
jgi:hypothetical protein